MNQRHTIVINLTSSISLDTVTGRVADSLDEKKLTLGTFFILLHIEDISSLVPWATAFAKFLEEIYYQTITVDPMISVERALSIARQKARNKLQQLSREGQNFNPETVHYCFGALKGNGLWLTHTPGIQAYLLHQFSGASYSTPRYRWLDILKTPSPRLGGAHESSLAATIVSGPIGNNDVLIICTPSITDTIGLERLEKIVTDVTWEGIETILMRHFRTAGGRWTFGAILLRPLATDSPPAVAVTSSMLNLSDKEKGTSAFLVRQNSKLYKRLWQNAARLVEQVIARKPRRAGQSAALPKPSWGWRLGRATRKIWTLLARTALFLILAPFKLASTILTDMGRQNIKNSAQRRYDAAIHRLGEYLQTLPRSAQRLLIISLLFAFLFVQSLVFLAARKTRENQLTTERQRLAQIQEQLDQAEANIIFHNSEKAILLLREAGDSIKQLPRRTREQLEAAEFLKQSLEEIIGHLERAVTITNPTMVGQVPLNIMANPDGLLLAGETLLLFKGENNTFVSVNSKSGETKKLPVASVNIGRMQIGLKDEGSRFVFWHDGQGLAVLDLATNTLAGEIVENNKNKAKAFGLYNKRLYILDPSNRQIWRYQKTSAGYGRVAPWLKGNAEEIRDASGLVVDGSVYVLLKNGTVKKFSNGNEADWQAQPLLTPPQNAGHLQSSAGSKFLYALDQESRRIFVWEKNSGRLVTQYVLKNMKSLRDFSVDEKNNIIYLLNGNTIEKIPISTT